MGKRIISMLMTVIMVISMISPMTVKASGAAEITAAEEISNQTASETKEPVSENPSGAEEMAVTPEDEISSEAPVLYAADIETKYDSYEQFLGYCYLTYSTLEFFLENDQIPYHTYVDNSDEDFEKTLAAWRKATMGASDVIDYSVKEEEFYELLIFDVLYQTLAQDTVLSNAKTGVNALQSSLLKDISEAGMDWTLLTEVTEDNADELLNRLIQFDNLKFLAGEVDLLKKGIEYTQTMEELIEKLYMLAQLDKCTEEVNTILNELYDNSTDPCMKEACRQVALISTGYLTEAEIIAIFSGEVALQEITKHALDKIWGAIASSNSLLQALGIGQAVGKLVSNVLVGTDAIVENWYSMRQVYTFEKVLKARLLTYKSRFESNPTYNNAKLFNKAADMYLNTLSVGMEYAIKYAESVKGGGFLGWIYKNFTHKDDYDSLMRSLNSIKSSIDLSIDFANNETYNYYLEDMEAYYATAVEWEETPSDATEEEITENLAEIPDINFELSNQTVDEDTAYSEDKRTYANYTLESGTLDLAGQTLTVYGDFYLKGGTLNVNGGVLEVRGDLYMTGGDIYLHGGTVDVGGSATLARINEDGSYSRLGSTSQVTMDNENDVFTIGGDLVTYLYSSNYFECSAGQLRIGGGWTNYNSSSSVTMSGSGTFETVFTGTGALEINGDGAFYVPTMTIENASARSITLRGTVKAGTLRGGAMTLTASGTPVLSFATTTDDLVINGDTQLAVATRAGGDITVNGDATLNGMTLFGNTLHITGDVLLKSDLTVGNAATENHGTAAIDGSLQMTGGKLYLNNGSLNVGGSATLAEVNGDGSYSRIHSTGSVVMDNGNDVFTIGGDLITYLYSSNYFDCSAGQLRIGGGWTNYNSSSSVTMSGSGTFETVFTGTGAVVINGNGAFYVPTMTIENASARSITLRGTVKAGTLRGGAMTLTASGTSVLSFATTTDDLVISGDTQLAVATRAGGDITVNGDATLNGMTLFGNTLHITGDVLLKSDLTVGNAATEIHGTAAIDGSLQMTGGKLYLNNGSVNVGGSATLAEVNGDGSYSRIHSTGSVVMDNGNDVFTIGGDLITYLYSSNYFDCSAGQLRIGGGWTNYNSSSSVTMSGSGTFETVFTGTGALEINGDGAFYVPTMTIENASARSITLRGTVKAGTLRGGAMTLTASGTPVLSFATTTDDLVINGDTQLAVATKAGGDITINDNLYSNGMTMGAHTLTVHKNLYLSTNNTLILGPSGSLCVDGDVHMSKGELSLAGTSTIGGSFYQSAGNVKPNGGIVTIRGDYRIQTADESSGELVWGNSSGRLHMVNSSDRVIVGGSFYTSSSSTHSGYLTAGTLYVCGDFVQNAGNSGSFKASGTHKVMLCGTRPQSATFASSGSKFNILQLTQDISQYTFNPNPCWAELQENVEIPDEVKCLNGHSWDDGTVQVAPGCLTEGVMRYTCTVCGQFYAQTLPAAGHDYGTAVTAPGCESQGYTTHTCSRCGDSYVDSYVEPVGHSYDSGRQTTAPTCEEAGVMTYCCTVCGSTHIEAIEALGHDYAAVVTEAGCLTQGYTTHTCSRCGDSYVDSYLDALGHAWDDGVVTKAPTTDEEGIRTYTCSRCAEKREEQIPALGSSGHTHDYTVVITPPTCTLQGYSTYTCACGDSYTADYVDALGHAWNSGSVNRYPTCDMDGSVEYICTVCGTEKTEVVPAYGHSYDYEEIDPTCTEYGYIQYTCDECDYTYRAELVDPLWHYYVDGVCRRCEAALPETLASGICGDQLTWTLTAEPGSWKAILTISGSGAMWDFDESLDDDPAPWSDLDLDVEITTIRIEDGCTSIGDYAFEYWSGNNIALETVILTDSITKIGKYAFSGHDGLKTIRMPEKLKTIEEGAFSETGLLDVILPDSVTHLQLSAFEDCEDLTRAELSDSLTSIAEDVFRDCGSLVDVRIPESVTKIEADAFRGTALYRIVLPDNVTRIGDRAFYDCSDVVGVITIGKNVISIGAGAFASCSSLDGFVVDTSNLYYSSDSEGLLLSKAKGTLVQVPGDTYGVFEIPEGVSRVGAYAFAGSKITEITIPDGVTGIGSYAFYYCTGLTKVTIPASVVSVGSFAFGSCSRLKEVTFLGSAPTFERDSWYEANAFSGVTAEVRYPADDETWTEVVKNQYGGVLTWIPVEAPKAVASGWSGATEWTLMDDGTLTVYGSGNMKNYGYGGGQPWLNKGVDITSVIIEEGVTAVGSGAFMNLTTLESVVLPETLTKMGEAAFYGSGLTSVEIPASLWTIQPYTFKNCANLTEVIFNEGNLQKISDGAFYGTGLTELTLPDCLDILDVYAFKGCANLTDITIGSGLTELREAVFYGTAIPTIVIPEGITKIGPYTFKNCVALETVDFPSTLTSVGEASFYADTALKAVELPDAVTSIGNYAFRKCAAIEPLKLSAELVTVGECAFYGCTGLTELVIPDKVTTIKPYAFKTCEGLTSVVLGESVRTIGEGAFNTCTGLKTIVFPASLESIGDYCFSGSYNLWKLTFEGDAPAIGDGAFKGLSATAYYPGDNATWTANVMQNYGGKLTWKAN